MKAQRALKLMLDPQYTPGSRKRKPHVIKSKILQVKLNKIKKNEKRWHWDEQQKYVQFIEKEIDFFLTQESSQKIKYGIYKKMAFFIKTRTPTQCRTHHQKMMYQHKSSKYIVQFFKNPNSKHSYEKKQTAVENSHEKEKKSFKLKGQKQEIKKQKYISLENPQSQQQNIKAQEQQQKIEKQIQISAKDTQEKFSLQEYCKLQVNAFEDLKIKIQEQEQEQINIQHQKQIKEQKYKLSKSRNVDEYLKQIIQIQQYYLNHPLLQEFLMFQNSSIYFGQNQTHLNHSEMSSMRRPYQNGYWRGQ